MVLILIYDRRLSHSYPCFTLYLVLKANAYCIPCNTLVAAKQNLLLQLFENILINI